MDSFARTAGGEVGMSERDYAVLGAWILGIVLWIAYQVSRAIKFHKKIDAICKKYESEANEDAADN